MKIVFYSLHSNVMEIKITGKNYIGFENKINYNNQENNCYNKYRHKLDTSNL